MLPRVVVFTTLFNLYLCQDYFMGMFKPNDLLVASDTLYKERAHFGPTQAKYGRLFRCPITYVKVSDRLGYGRSPRVSLTRGGLQKKYIHLVLTSARGHPINVNIYVGCENKLRLKTTTAMAKTSGTTLKTVSAADDKETVGTEAVTPAPEDAEPEAIDGGTPAAEVDAPEEPPATQDPTGNEEPAITGGGDAQEETVASTDAPEPGGD